MAYVTEKLLPKLKSSSQLRNNNISLNSVNNKFNESKNDVVTHL